MKTPIQILEERLLEIKTQRKVAQKNKCNDVKELMRLESMYSTSIKYLELMLGSRVKLNIIHKHK